MSKLLKWRQWVDLLAAAQYLSEALEEPITQADLLRLALERHLTLSVHLVNKVPARAARIVPHEEAPAVVSGWTNDGDAVLADAEVVYLDGLYDYAMGDLRC